MPLINPGSPAPAFSLPDQMAKVRTLAGYKGRHLVLYFYPKDDTSSCTVEACGFRDGLPAFGKLKAAVLGVSPDSVKSHAKFVAKYALTFPLLADEPGPDGVPSLCQAMGVWTEKSMYGKKYMGVARTTYIIDPEGRVSHRFDSVKSDGHAEEVIAALGGSSKKPKTKPAVKKVAKPAAKKMAKPAVKKALKTGGKGDSRLAGSTKKTSRRS